MKNITYVEIFNRIRKGLVQEFCVRVSVCHLVSLVSVLSFPVGFRGFHDPYSSNCGHPVCEGQGGDIVTDITICVLSSTTGPDSRTSSGDWNVPWDIWERKVLQENVKAVYPLSLGRVRLFVFLWKTFSLFPKTLTVTSYHTRRYT